MAYEVTLSPSAEKELLNLPANIQLRVENAIDFLQNQPRPRGVVKLKGEQNLFRLRVGQYRIIYSIDDENHIIDIGYIRHRRDVYKRRR